MKAPWESSSRSIFDQKSGFTTLKPKENFLNIFRWTQKPYMRRRTFSAKWQKRKLSNSNQEMANTPSLKYSIVVQKKLRMKVQSENAQFSWCWGYLAKTWLDLVLAKYMLPQRPCHNLYAMRQFPGVTKADKNFWKCSLVSSRKSKNLE